MTRCGYTPETHGREASSVKFSAHPHKTADTDKEKNVPATIFIFIPFIVQK
jgi:hypothetical protein